ncbi:MAG: YbjN domain-containing protein [Pseudomonadota bacterium]
MALAQVEYERDIHPVDLIEHVASLNQWEFERSSDDEINLTVKGVWTDYDVSLSWMEDFEALHLACAFDLKVPDSRILETIRLLSLINEQMLIGHFDVWMREGAVMFRQTLMLNGGADPTGEQLECLLASAIEACERYYQAFQFVVWAGHDADEAIKSALFETSGTA